MTFTIGIIGFAVCFALYGVTRYNRGCGGDCGACSSGCAADNRQES